jgi:tRNA(adenine34) deaminase
MKFHQLLAKPLLSLSDQDWFMSLALEEANLAFKKEEVPVGCVLVDRFGKILSQAHNLKEVQLNPCAHAECLAITQAAQKMKSWRLEGVSLFVTLEPCFMCMGAILAARIDHLYFGAYDPKGGFLSLKMNTQSWNKLNHAFTIVGGVKHYECSQQLSTFFRQQRHFY